MKESSFLKRYSLWISYNFYYSCYFASLIIMRKKSFSENLLIFVKKHFFLFFTSYRLYKQLPWKVRRTFHYLLVVIYLIIYGVSFWYYVDYLIQNAPPSSK